MAMSLVLLLGAVFCWIDQSRRPALPLSPSVASAASSLPALPKAVVRVMPTARATVTPTPAPTLVSVLDIADWRPTPTATPTATPLPASMVLRGPQSLVLWTGQKIAVQPSLGQWQNETYQWQMPRDAAGWHTNTPDCGLGTTLVGGHISFNGVPGVFASLVGIGEQDRVMCQDAYGQAHLFIPVDYLMASAHDDPSVWSPAWSPSLVLYTCAPELDGRIIVVRFQEE